MSRRGTRGGDLPLIEWGETRRRCEFARRRLYRRVVLVAGLIGAVGFATAFPPVPRLVWNASASAPIGLYAVRSGASVWRGAIVIVRIPSGVRSLAASRRYVPANVPLVKHVGAVAGDVVCAIGQTITVDGKAVANRRPADRFGRPMAWWSGCRSLRWGEVFLLTADVPSSFDGRYFGVTPSADIIGIARPIWTR